MKKILISLGIICAGIFVLAQSASAVNFTKDQVEFLIKYLNLDGEKASILRGLVTNENYSIVKPEQEPNENQSLTLNYDMSIGSTGKDVATLQNFLVQRGFLVLPPDTGLGYFGALTQSALAKWQASVGISPASGYCGPATRNKLNSELKTGNSESKDKVTIKKPVIEIDSSGYAKYCNIPSDSFNNLDASAYSPKLLNIDFGAWLDLKAEKTGAAIVGNTGDFWNTVAVPNCSNHLRSGLKFADGSDSPIKVQMSNLGGGWASSATAGKYPAMGIDDRMLDNFNYSQSSNTNSYVILHGVPEGSYDLYLYNKTMTATQNGDYTVNVGGRSYGRKVTATDQNSSNAGKWGEGNQFVKFSIEVKDGEGITILIAPGGAPYHQAQISGLQLAPAGTRPAVSYDIYKPETVESSNITLVSPKGGESYTIGKDMKIAWNGTILNSTGEETVYMELRRGQDFSGNYIGSPIKIGVVPFKNVSYLWRIPESITPGQYYLEIYKANSNGVIDSQESVKAISERAITIYGTKTYQQQIVNVLSPNGGETLTAGQSTYIKFKSATSSVPVKITLIGKAYEKEIGTITPSTAGQNVTYLWRIPSDIPTSSSYTICVSNTLNSNDRDCSDGQFTINGVTTGNEPNITSISQDSGPVGTVLEIRGNNLAGFEGGLYAIFRRSDGKTVRLGSIEPYWSGRTGDPVNTSLIKVKIQSPCNRGDMVHVEYSGIETICDYFEFSPGAYKIYVNPWGKKSNEVAFTVTSSPVNNPTINVTSPNGGETWYTGQSQYIKFTSSGISGVSIYLKKDGENVQTISEWTTAGSSSYGTTYLWRIPSTIPPASGYQICVNDSGSKDSEDCSNTTFSIWSPETEIHTTDDINAGASAAGAIPDDLFWNFMNVLKQNR